ncbi:MAG: hypothetical protein EXR71_17970 [Myxococcales bacterium]|nr:hypothetical protein [Myxococcales bacterium]
MAITTLRRAWVLAFGGIVLGLGTGTAAWAGRDPTASEIERYCSLEDEGAHQLAQDLLHRERELDGRADALDSQRAELAAAEARLTDRLAALEKARADIQALIGVADAARDARVDGIVKMVEANRAGSIAPMFAQLDEPLAVTVLDKMKRKKAGQLLAVLPAAKAAALAQRMAEPVAVDLP